MKKLKYFVLTKSIGLYLNLLSYIKPNKAKQHAYRIFSEPRIGKISLNKLPKTIQKATIETLYHNEHQFKSYIWSGNSNVILLLHGWESNASRWKKMLPYLQKSGSTIIAIDAPAHGLSTGKEFNVPKYAEFIAIAVQKYNPKTIIAHSIGGAATAFYLDHHKNTNIEKVVLLGSPSEMKIIIDNYIQLLGLNSRIGNFLKNQSLVKFNINIETFSSHLFAENLIQKAFIAHDQYDKIVKIEEGRKISNAWPNSIYHETKGLGHSMHDHDLYSKIYHFLFE